MSEAVAPVIALRRAQSPDDLTVAAELIAAYAQSLAEAHCVADLADELVELGHRYGPPAGGLVLAWVDSAPAGCCAFRPLPDTDHTNACEMKRLYVRPAFRKLGLGHALVEAVMEGAKIAGYSCVLLDTLDEMEAARALYEEMGFVEVAPYVQSPIPGAHHLKAEL